MLEIEKKKFFFKTKEIWFCEYPFNVKEYHSVIFRGCKNKTVLKGFVCEEFTTLVIDLTQDLDVIWKNMSKMCSESGKELDFARIAENFESLYFQTVNHL